MGAGFSGYVLVGSQMRYWAAIVITSLIRVLPVVGEGLIYWVWGGYSISWVTISLIFVAHFLLPFVVLFMLGFHLLILHNRGRTRLVFSHSGVSKVTFYPYYWIKDAINVRVYMLLVVLILLYPYSLGEVELFEEANTLVSPTHIVPEWYFCRQYAILRRVPSKGAGVIIIIFRVVVYFLYPTRIRSITPASGVNIAAVVSLVCVQVMLTYLGFAPIEQPFVFLSLIFTLLYFLIHVLVMSVNLLADYYFDVRSGNTMEEGTKETLVVEETAERLLGLHALARDFPLQ
jgi:quinol-cytochrome oxidoreductase complex cytochrome b subunit